jgi:hypothetical protein
MLILLRRRYCEGHISNYLSARAPVRDTSFSVRIFISVVLRHPVRRPGAQLRGKPLQAEKLYCPGVKVSGFTSSFELQDNDQNCNLKMANILRKLFIEPFWQGLKMHIVNYCLD